MHDPSQNTPAGLLLATDLSARCDRPLERARQLAGEFSTPLVTLTVFDIPQAPSDVIQWLDGDIGREGEEAAARAELAREFAGSPLEVSTRFATGPVAEAILEAAATLPGTIVVTGASHPDSLGELLLGSTVERLARDLAQPLLVVRRRVRGPYRNIMVAVDFTPASRAALEGAARLFPQARIVAFHVHDADILGEEAPPRAEFARFLSGCALAPEVHVMHTIGAGEPASQLARYVQEHAIDLAVFGLHAETALERLLKGSRSEVLLQEINCDTLLIRPGEYNDNND